MLHSCTHMATVGVKRWLTGCYLLDWLGVGHLFVGEVSHRHLAYVITDHLTDVFSEAVGSSMLHDQHIYIMGQARVRRPTFMATADICCFGLWSILLLQDFSWCDNLCCLLGSSIKDVRTEGGEGVKLNADRSGQGGGRVNYGWYFVDVLYGWPLLGLLEKSTTNCHRNSIVSRWITLWIKIFLIIRSSHISPDSRCIYCQLQVQTAFDYQKFPGKQQNSQTFQSKHNSQTFPDFPENGNPNLLKQSKEASPRIVIYRDHHLSSLPNQVWCSVGMPIDTLTFSTQQTFETKQNCKNAKAKAATEISPEL